ncbi:hypothetical protein GALMADRAFT_460355 [Galerina marginata CBS 339.88]|uniref:Uncharacterized protein n=1 Tax=Galerina marginata (strain CBS 339.88) TaxID=685588 RepID=A0A067T198_GALM3|nr:hypothetical protein GALMADRAFT_460355 [Galerina marginata CBS 339.88]
MKNAERTAFPRLLQKHALPRQFPSLSKFEAATPTLISAPTQVSPARHRLSHIAAGSHELQVLTRPSQPQASFESKVTYVPVSLTAFPVHSTVRLWTWDKLNDKAIFQHSSHTVLTGCLLVFSNLLCTSIR